jgi:serine/threonine protein kinase
VTLSAGTTIGPCEIQSALGAGGMGELYRARDAKLNRDVALKVLPEAFALDPDRLARFKREAQVLASLNHPHIAAIYGSKIRAAHMRSCSSWLRVRPLAPSRCWTSDWRRHWSPSRA